MTKHPHDYNMALAEAHAQPNPPECGCCGNKEEDELLFNSRADEWLCGACHEFLQLAGTDVSAWREPQDPRDTE